MIRRLLAATLLAGVSLAGCFLVTGSTDGYVASEAGGSPSCMSASSCADGSVCCLVLTSSSTSLAGTCQATCANAAYPQLCTTNAECGDAGACTKQSCTVDAGGGVTVSVQACGTLPGCAASH